MNKINFYFWTSVITIILLSTLNNANGSYHYYDGTTNFTQDEAIEIAQSNPEVSGWLNETNGWIVSVEQDYSYWHLIFRAQSDSLFLHVIVDDVSGEVVSVNYQNSDDRGYFYEDSTLLDEAKNYFLGLPESTAFTEMNFDIQLGYSGVANYIDLYGWAWDGNTDLNMNGWIKFNLSQSGYIFSLTFINSNVQFGGTNMTFSDAENQALGQPNVMNFYGNYSVSEVNTRQWLINEDFRRWEDENKMKGLEPGYYFEIRYESWEYYSDVVTSTIIAPALDESIGEIIIEHDGSNWHEVVISDFTRDVAREFGTSMKNHSFTEIEEIVLTDSEIIEWLVEVNQPFMYIYFDGFGIFYIDIWSNIWAESTRIIISDKTGEILEKNIQRAIYPTKSNQDILSIALSNPDISNWVLNTENYHVNYHYDFGGEWYIEFFDPIISESWANLAINDTNGYIFWAEAHIGRTPDLSKDQVINIALSSDLSVFYNKNPDAKISMFYNYNDEWWVFVYSPVILEEYVLIIIDDDNSRIIEVEQHRASSWPNSSYTDVEAAMLLDETYQEFVSTYPVEYQSIYYYNNYWFVYIEATNSAGFGAFFEMEITDNTARVEGAGYYESGEYGSRSPRGQEIQWHFQDQWSARYVGKHLSSPLEEYIEGYLPITTNTTSTPTGSNENTSPNVDLNGFSLLPSVIAIFVMIPIYLKRKINN